MKVEFHDYAVNERPVRSFDNADELLDFLRQFRTEEFASAELLADNGFRLTIGIDGDITFVQFSSEDGYPPYSMAISPTVVVEGMHIFLVTNEGTEMYGRHCLAFPVFEEVVRHFVETGEKTPAIQWEDA